MTRFIPPEVAEAITKLGQDIRKGRLRRHISVDDMKTEASISRTTLYKVEKGDPKVEISTYATVLYVLGKLTLKRFADVADTDHDPWRDIEEKDLPKRIRKSHRRMTDADEPD
jgi:predicted transcriptional regulator